ncbi:MAG: hypothetical protein KGI52_09360 [Burkholderiales bacterium]|nr:hypothetical protein [Burkholderiales bacterium]
MNGFSHQAHQLVIYEEAEWRMRLASAADNTRLCELFRDVDMSADLCLAEERGPDFFALQRLQSDAAYSVMLEDPRQPGQPAFGCASILARDAWIDGHVQRIGYACDLRIEASHRGGRIFPTVIREFMRFMQKQEGIDMMYSAVLSSHELGRNALLHQGIKRQGQPLAQVMTAYNMTSIQFVGGRQALDPRVQRAQASDRPALIDFLAQQQKHRFLGYVVNERWLEQRLRDWPGLTLEDFFVLKDGDGRVLACAAPWDSAPNLRCSRVVAYQGSMRALKVAYNLEARLRGFPPLPEVGECFRFQYLTHLEVQNDDPALLNALLRGIYNELRTQPLHFMSLMVPQGSRLEAGLHGFRIRRIPMELIAFTNERSALHGQVIRTLNPGFEMALH